jgi:hypothetical protein
MKILDKFPINQPLTDTVKGISMKPSFLINWQHSLRQTHIPNLTMALAHTLKNKIIRKAIFYAPS